VLRPFLAIVALGLLAIPASATATPGHFVFPASRTLEASVPASHGFRLQISARPRQGLVVQASNGQTITSYWVKTAIVDGGTIKARLPGIGRLALRFQPDGPAHEGEPFCKGRPDRVETGTFVGAIHFRGERGYTEVTATKARGRIITSYRQVCGGNDSDSAIPDDIRWITLSAGTERPNGSYASFSASRIETGFGDDDGTSLLAFANDPPGRIQIFRIASVTGNAALFNVPDLERRGSATVIAKAPFSGTATYRAEGNGTASWTGDLSVEFPGLGEVRLAGPKFSAGLCLNERCSGESSRGGGSLSVGSRPW
jgi:hypothetical protein